MDETEYLLRSPKNAERLYRAFEQAEKQHLQPTTIAEIRREFGLERDEPETTSPDEANPDTKSDSEDD